MIISSVNANVCFDLEKEIGEEGKNSQVFLAHDHQFDATIVIKKIEKAKLGGNHSAFFREVQILYASSHENVIDVHYACEDEDSIYIAMPYYPNGSLKRKMAGEYLTVREIIKYSLQVIAGLHNIHVKKLIHFDIKPDNILLSDRNEAIISDFGLSKYMNYEGMAEPDTFYNKHRPPEAFKHKAFDLRFDIYQFGLTLYRMCNGDNNFSSQLNNFVDLYGNFDRFKYQTSCLNGKFPDRNIFLPHIPNSLKKIIRKCLAVSPDDRYSSVVEIGNDLSKIEGNILDWQYSKNNGTEKWSKKYEDKVVSLIVNGSSSSAYKEYDGKSRRITDYCKNYISQTDITSFFEKY